MIDEEQRKVGALAKTQRKSIKLSEHERIVTILHEELFRKDKIIEDLKLENQMILKTALKRSEVLNDLQKKMINSLDKKDKRTTD